MTRLELLNRYGNPPHVGPVRNLTDAVRETILDWLLEHHDDLDLIEHRAVEQIVLAEASLTFAEDRLRRQAITAQRERRIGDHRQGPDHA